MKIQFNKIFLIFLFLSLVVATKAQTLVLTVLVPVIDIPMATASHYANGNTVSVTGAVSVLSTVNWDLSARVNSHFINGSNSIDCSNFGIDVTNPVGTQQPEKFLALTNQAIVSNASPVLITALALNVNYRAVGGSSFLNKPPGGYAATLVYTLSAH